MKKAIIVVNGIIDNIERIKENISAKGFDRPDLVIAADGGTRNALLLKLNPQIVVGDMDSIDPETRAKMEDRNVKFVQQPVAKDYTDTYHAVKEASSKGIDNILILGATGGRLDHTLANMMLLADPGLAQKNITIITETQEIFVLSQSAEIQGKEGSQVSLFSLTPYTYFIKTRGLKYKLEQEKLLFSPVRGVSNQFSASQAKLNISEGILLVIKDL